ncbi:hypothetical protein GCM10023149_35510 [Mucilaginibacter gynuensis]|uniref:Uncharacterized protein n=1 Tax=Mucilaginibacter gynuensis TaxID=1302236 RepID=A0ABP8GV79_9SPHI
MNINQRIIRERKPVSTLPLVDSINSRKGDSGSSLKIKFSILKIAKLKNAISNNKPKIESIFQ